MNIPEMVCRIVNRMLSLAVIGLLLLSSTTFGKIQRYNVVWDSPSIDASGQMPIGNGDIAAGVYAIADGDLYLLLAKNDAYSYAGDIFKTGRVRVSLSPNPFAKGKKFKQTLDLQTGSVLFECDGVTVRVWADANRPIYHIQIDSKSDIEVSTEPEFWERIDNCGYNNFDVSSEDSQKEMQAKPIQDVRLDRKGNIVWYYAVGDKSVYSADLKYYDIEHMADKFADPYRFNTFGNLLESSNLKLKDGKLKGKSKRFDIRIHSLTKQAKEASDWIKTIEKQAAKKRKTKSNWADHCKWWSDFWAKSWIVVSDNTLPKEDRNKLSGEAVASKRNDKDGGAIVAQSYNVFRYLMACQSRAKVQTKFNGGLFTQPLRFKENTGRLHKTKMADGTWLSHEDDRDWGRRFTFQNQRLLYWPLLMSGDYDEMMPFFNYYWNLLDVRKAITKAWFDHDGAYYRENIEPTGGERDCGRDGKPLKIKAGENTGQGYYHSFYFTCGLETVTMMIDYVKHTQDLQFRDTVLAPFAKEVLLFFDKHYQRDADGKIRLDPAMVLETWWIAVNPAPDIAGLQYCLDELLAIGAGSKKDQTYWKRFRSEIPEIHMHQIDGHTAIAPAKEWKLRKNSENGLLYPVFPFRCFGLGHGTEHIVAHTMEHRTNKNAFNYKCWTQDQIHWAYAGNAKEAKDGLIHRFRHASTQCRFPLYGSAGPDSCPDFDHYGSGSTALQRMLVQEVDDKILLLPAWPADWDADFKLHLTKQTVIQGNVTNGKLTNWTIKPATRKKDVTVYKPQ